MAKEMPVVSLVVEDEKGTASDGDAFFVFMRDDER